MTYTYEQIEKIIVEVGINTFYEAISIYESQSYESIDKFENLWRHADYYTGQGEEFAEIYPSDLFFKVIYDQFAPDGDVECVVHFYESNVYIKMKGYYSSYGDSDLDIFEVFPQQVTEIKYLPNA